MAWTWNVTKIVRREQEIDVFGSLSFTGSYVSGGDAGGSLLIGNGTAGWPQWTPQESGLHATLPPTEGNLQLDGGYTGSIVPGSAVLPARVKIYTAAAAELTAGAYPAAVTGATQHTLRLTYRKNL